MNTENQETLRKQYPELYSDVDFKCGDGWVQVLATVAQRVMDTGKVVVVTEITRRQRGGLRWSFACMDTEYLYITRIVQVFERISFATCEYCGRDGREVAMRGQYVIRCYVHSDSIHNAHYDL